MRENEFNKNNNSILISFSGIDGSGKTTLLNSLADYFFSKGKDTLITKQPTSEYRKHPLVRENLNTGHTDVGPEAIALLSAFDRLCHVSYLKEELKKTKIIFSDRFLLDGIVSFVARGVDENWVKEINKFCPGPHIEILVDCSGEIAHERIVKRGGAMTYDEKSPDILEEKRKLFLKYKNSSTHVLDGTESEEILFKKALQYIESYINTEMKIIRN